MEARRTRSTTVAAKVAASSISNNRKQRLSKVYKQPAFFQDMAKWISSGQMKYEETIKDGIDKAPEAFLGLFEGANTGKMLVKLG